MIRAGLLALLLTGCCAGCATAPEKAAEVREVSQDILGDLLFYAEGAQAVTLQLCKLDREGKPCRFLVLALDAFYSRAEQVEAAMNAGEDVSDRLESLLAEVKALYRVAQDFLKGIA